MVVHKLTLGTQFQANCYVLENDKKEALAIDIGGDSSEFLKFIEKNNLRLTKIILTHGHYDHFRGVADVADATNAEVFIHKDDAAMLTSAEKSLAFQISNEVFSPVGKYTVVTEDDIIDFSGEPVRIVHTPGHTPGCVCYICGDNMFSGDTLFRMSIGRTDLPGGDYSQIINSLKKLKALGKDADYHVYPGHEGSTSLKFEINNNPYMR
ncbi:MAG: MBL fold metallo-hydrolase [Oscillospiraceae bacterium]|nr:MBL fold metallo-hydrolase [Oscillospiraceae bacterium]